ncbi:MAG: isoprenylcysteine carboxylmethyltransferase family protein [Chloroflexi bacterium]|nr:isoprenylcysteine carboxylmethyltransferase family protein [Chloroflexota bacterium]
MRSRSGTAAAEGRPSVAGGIAVRVGLVAFFLILQMAILLLSAGRVGWVWAWVYLGISLVSAGTGGAITLRASPEAVAERGRWPLGTKGWDRVIGTLWLLLLYILLPLVAGLDERSGWTRGLSSAWNLTGALVLAAGYGLCEWALIVNTYFSTAVRIQSDRGQTVCRSGPYRLVRHPGYAGYILQCLGTALLLGSWWALVPGGLAAAVIATRTALEDRLLQEELPGYPDYAQEVRYRLIPGVW